jgi:hypothetical protein
MMDLAKIVEEGALKITFPKEYPSVAEILRARGFIVREEGNSYVVLSPTSFSISRTQAKLSLADLRKFFKNAKVFGGFKEFEGEREAIHFRPKRPLVMTFKVSVPERKLIEFAARQYLLDVSEYVRMCVVDNAIEAFITASKQKETGLV